MSNITPCLWFNTNVEEAANFYVSVFRGGKILKTTYYGKAGYLPADTVLTVEFEVEGQKMMGLNGGRDPQYTDSLSLCVHCDTQETLDDYWAKLTADGGKEVECGWLKDRYGVSWQIVPRRLDELLDDPDEERTARVMQALLGMVKIDIAALEAAAQG